MPAAPYWTTVNNALSPDERRAFNLWRKKTLATLGGLIERYNRKDGPVDLTALSVSEALRFGERFADLAKKVEELPELEPPGDELSKILGALHELCGRLSDVNPDVDVPARIGGAAVIAGQLRRHLQTLAEAGWEFINPAETKARATAPPTLVVNDVTPPPADRPAEPEDGRSLRPLIESVKAKVDEIMADLADPNRAHDPFFDNGRWSINAALTLGLVQGCLAQCRASAPAVGLFQETFDAIGALMNRVSRAHPVQPFNADRWHLLAATVLSDAQAALQLLLDAALVETPPLSRSA